MTPLQSKLLEMLSWLDRYIRDHKLTYYVVGGTLIGAARHQGFIPWDDDIDIAMPRPDYLQLCQLLKEPVDHYVIEATNSQAPEYLYTFAKFYDINTSMTEYLRTKVHRGVYIDIFPLDGLGNTMDEALKNYKIIDRKNMFLMTRTCEYRKDRKLYKNIAIALARLIPNFLVDEKRLAISIDQLNQKFKYNECDYVSITMSTYRELYNRAFAEGKGICGNVFTNTLYCDYGKRIYFTKDSETNMKVTTPEDLVLMKAYLNVMNEVSK